MLVHQPREGPEREDLEVPSELRRVEGQSGVVPLQAQCRHHTEVFGFLVDEFDLVHLDAHAHLPRFARRRPQDQAVQFAWRLGVGVA
jgi:hypothetical protein